MTLLCAVLTDDAVLLAADDRATSFETDPRFPKGFPVWADDAGEKFMPTGVPSVMWGYVGMGAIAERLVGWAEKGAWSSWDALIADAEKQSAKAVRTIKQKVIARKGDPNDQFLTFGMLLGGYVNGEQEICWINEMGIPGKVAEKNVPVAVGGAQTIALAAWNVHTAFNPEATVTTPQELADFANAVCDSVVPLDPPCGVWKVTPEGHERCSVTYTKARIGVTPG